MCVCKIIELFPDCPKQIFNLRSPSIFEWPQYHKKVPLLYLLSRGRWSTETKICALLVRVVADVILEIQSTVSFTPP